MQSSNIFKMNDSPERSKWYRLHKKSHFNISSSSNCQGSEQLRISRMILNYATE